MEQRSERAGLLAALAAPMLLWAVRASWLWVLAGGAAAAGQMVQVQICKCGFVPEAKE